MRQRIMGVLQQLQDAPSQILLCDLRVETGDGLAVPRTVLELVKERPHLAPGLISDEPAAGLP